MGHAGLAINDTRINDTRVHPVRVHAVPAVISFGGAGEHYPDLHDPAQPRVVRHKCIRPLMNGSGDLDGVRREQPVSGRQVEVIY